MQFALGRKQVPGNASAQHAARSTEEVTEPHSESGTCEAAGVRTQGTASEQQPHSMPAGPLHVDSHGPAASSGVKVTLLRRPAPSSEANAPLVADRQPGGPEADAWLGSRLCSDQAQSLQGPSRRSDVDQTSNGAQQLQSHGMDPEQGLDTRRVLNEVVAGNDIAKENEARLADMAPAEVGEGSAESCWIQLPVTFSSDHCDSHLCMPF